MMAIILIIGMILLALAPSCSREAGAEPMYSVGDSVWVYFTPLDTLGFAYSPITLSGGEEIRLYAYRSGDIWGQVGFNLAGTLTGLTPVTETAPDDSTMWRGFFVIPATWADEKKYDLLFDGRVTGGGYTNQPGRTVPMMARVNNVVVDSFDVAALSDFWVGIEDATVGAIDSTSCTPCGAYNSSGQGLSGAQVVATRTRSYDYLPVGRAISTNGNYRMRVPLDPVLPDTFYVHVIYGNQFTVTGMEVVFP